MLTEYLVVEDVDEKELNHFNEKVYVILTSFHFDVAS